MSHIVLDMIIEGENNMCVLSVKQHTDEVKKSILSLNSSVCYPMNGMYRTLLIGLCNEKNSLYSTLIQKFLFSRQAGRTPEETK